MTKPDEFSFCTVTSLQLGMSHRNTWHIRRLSSKGKLIGAKMDTSSLCGKLDNGFDIATSIKPEEFESSHLVCKTCGREYDRATEKGSK